MLTESWIELQAFLNGLPLPTPKAVVLLTLIVALLALVARVLSALIRYVTGPEQQQVALTLVSEPGDDRVARVTKARLDKLGLKERARVLVRTEAKDRKYVIALLLTRNASSKFDESNIALTNAAIRKLGLGEAVKDDPDPVPKMVISPLPWYWPSGVAYRTILDPDRNVSLTWIVTVVSTVVGLLISEIYFQREMSYQEAPPTLRPSINDTASSS